MIKKIIKIVFAVLMLIIIAGAIAWFGFLRPDPPPISDSDRAQIELMPLPGQMKLGSGAYTVDSQMGYSIKGESNEKVNQTLTRFYHKLRTVTGSKIEMIEGENLVIEIQELNNRYPSLEDDESYSLIVKESKIVLKARSESGVVYGLESLLQLVTNRSGRWEIQEMELTDHPRYPWRGLMIDMARHWMDKESILRNLEAMAALKMNVLHLHLTDYQGFRIESKKYPKLHEMGSEGQYYSQEDMREIIDFAAQRNIRIVPEFDLPGHTTSWFVGHPELASAPGPYVLDSVFGVLDPVLDPTREEVYDFLDNFIGEMAELFPDEYMHIGGDEVHPAHWNESESIQSFMRSQSLEDAHALQAYFNRRMQKILEKHNKKMLGWDEIMNPDLPQDKIAIQSWRSHTSLWEAARRGNKAILSKGFYLDYKQPASYHYAVDPLKIEGGVTIEIDSTNWKAWDFTMYVRDSEINGSLYMFGNEDNTRGIMSVMGQLSDFRDVEVVDNSYTFTSNFSVGEAEVDLVTEGDSIKGTLNISVFTVDIKGKSVGGSDRNDGIDLPKFEKVQPLTEGEKKSIIGGEACIWSELVDDRTLDSRIWPRTAAIAEKFWSPEVLTQNETDMYRRLKIMDRRLEEMGLEHNSSPVEILAEMTPEDFLEPLQVLVSVLEEVKNYDRMMGGLYGDSLTTRTPLNRIVDAAAPESYSAYYFNRDVEDYLESGDTESRKRIEEELRLWSGNHDRLAPLFSLADSTSASSEESIQRLILLRSDAEDHSRHLSDLSAIALKKIRGSEMTIPEEALHSLIMASEEPSGGTLLSVHEGLKRLIEN